MKGTIKWYNKKKGYGFVLGEDGQDYFIHHSQLVTNNEFSFKENDVVTFKAVETKKGLQAHNIVKCA